MGDNIEWYDPNFKDLLVEEQCDVCYDHYQLCNRVYDTFKKKKLISCNTICTCISVVIFRYCKQSMYYFCCGRHFMSNAL